MSECDDELNIYELKHEEQGHGALLIFNNFHFCERGNKGTLEQCKEAGCRFGSDKDVEKLRNLFEKKLKYGVMCLIDKTTNEIKKFLKLYSECSYADYDSLIVIIMSHGERDTKGDHVICTNTRQTVEHTRLYLKDFIEPFKTVHTLKNKPKLFFVNACLIEEESDLEFDSFLSRESYKKRSKRLPHVPIEADFLVSYANVDRFCEFQSKNAWFIQSLCEMIHENNENKDVLSILTRINRKLVNMKSYEKADKMMPTCIHQLRKYFYFSKVSNSIEVKFKI